MFSQQHNGQLKYPSFKDWLDWQIHEQTGETQISLDIDTVWSESLLSAWTNAQADLSLLGFQAILLDWTWFEFSRIYSDLWK